MPFKTVFQSISDRLIETKGKTEEREMTDERKKCPNTPPTHTATAANQIVGGLGTAS